MMFSSAFNTAMLVASAGLASALPTAAVLDSRDSSNCTEYSSTAAGTVCLQRPSDCTATYLVQPGDTCDTIGYLYNTLTLSALYYWNPDIGRTCFGLRAYTPVCINTPWYTYTPPVQSAAGTITTTANLNAVQQPVPVIPGTSDSCAKYELAGDGVYMYQMVQDNGITDDQFLQWNPSVNGSNPQIWGGYWYAVGC